MRFYTKEWYELVQHHDDTMCMKRIPDKDYSDREIKDLFEKKRKSEIARDRREYNSPPSFLDLSDRLTPENFDPESWLVFPENEEPRHPISAEEVRDQLERDRKQAEENFASRPPFDPSESEALFREDSALLSLRKRGRNYEMLLRKDGGWFGEGATPYIRVIFNDAVLLEREKGLTPRTQVNQDGTLWSNCIYLYHEMYSVQDGYEVHMLFATRMRSELAYLTEKCRDICFEDNIQN